MKISNRTIIGIDPGLSGGICVWSKGGIKTAAKMPKSVIEMKRYFDFLNETYQDCIVFIEKVQAYVDEGEEEKFKKFNINKMLWNYCELITVITLSQIEYVEVHPISWQSTLQLRIKKDTRSKTERKNSYKIYAQNCFPEVKVISNTADALCLIQFALVKSITNIDWIKERIKNKKTNELQF